MSRQTRVAVIGAGSWGTTVASLAARTRRRCCGRARGRRGDQRRHTNGRYLADGELPPGCEPPTRSRRRSRPRTCSSWACPRTAFATARGGRAARPAVDPGGQPDQGPRAGHPAAHDRGDRRGPARATRPACSPGPTSPRRCSAGHAAAAVIAMPDEQVARRCRRSSGRRSFRVYTRRDVIGAELAGALKNVVAIAAGMADGLGTGDNTRALVIAAALAELTRLGVAMGGERDVRRARRRWAT